MAEQNHTNQTVIGAGARFKGELTLSGGALIQGSVEGSVTAEGPGELKFAAQSQTRASVRAATILIEGQYDGDVLATERLQLTASARVTGEVVAAALIVAEGAIFSGKVAVGPDAVATALKGQPPIAATAPIAAATPAVTTSAPSLESKPSRTSVRLPDWAAGSGTPGEVAVNRSDWMSQTTGRTSQKSASAD